jgi:hypothetical protein
MYLSSLYTAIYVSQFHPILESAYLKEDYTVQVCKFHFFLEFLCYISAWSCSSHTKFQHDLTVVTSLRFASSYALCISFHRILYTPITSIHLSLQSTYLVPPDPTIYIPHFHQILHSDYLSSPQPTIYVPQFHQLQQSPYFTFVRPCNRII